jgi:hypothetical protein
MNQIQRITGALLAALLAGSASFAQTTQPTSTSPTTPTQLTPPTQPELVSPEVMQTPAPQVQIKAGSAQEFLSSLATKFGTSVSRLQSLLAKLPPRGRGLNVLEIKVIAGKLGLSKQDKAIFASKAGAGGTGFNSQDIAAMSRQLGLSLEETTRLSSELGLPAPAASVGAAGSAF